MNSDIGVRGEGVSGGVSSSDVVGCALRIWLGEEAEKGGGCRRREQLIFCAYIGEEDRTEMDML